ncbi:DUF2848 domain-containing protein [Paenirhodobacter populi]|uniref:DUF2848 domain-containing protein n=1 Tax=Paenirhodobacter populi TaxID=2306993 RepID=UPI000FE436D8|nr:DUF2848 domain-containing protein [Sinirhodobacter populi]RWR05445.1 DUF2848 domain-containing protein [Sinirhodobacter populi]
MKFDIISASGTTATEIDIRKLVIAGWAGRDKEKMEHHIQELEALGVARPKTTPTFYRASAVRLTTTAEIEELGDASSGEVEPLLIRHDGALFIGVGSDHTDREVEAYGVSVSKQMCAKPVAAQLWPLDEVADHWDELVLRSWIDTPTGRALYQEGSVASLLDPRDTLAKFEAEQVFGDGTAMLCGTMPAIGGIRSSGHFIAELEDPILGRKIGFGYRVSSLPIMG